MEKKILAAVGQRDWIKVDSKASVVPKSCDGDMPFDNDQLKLSRSDCLISLAEAGGSKRVQEGQACHDA